MLLRARIIGAQGFDIEHIDFSRVFLIAILVVPRPSLEFALDVDQVTLVQIGLHKSLDRFAPNDNVMPFGFLLFVAVAVGVGLVCRETEICDSLTTTCVSNFRVFAQSADEKYFVDA